MSHPLWGFPYLLEPCLSSVGLLQKRAHCYASPLTLWGTTEMCQGTSMLTARTLWRIFRVALRETFLPPGLYLEE